MDLSIMELIKTIILGIVEGLTEWLPISSTGHMILVDEFIQLDVSKAFMDMFLVVIQLGAILAVVVLNFEKLNPFSHWKTKREKKETFQLWYKVIFACIPAAVIGLTFNHYMEEHFMTAPVVAFTLIFYGVMFILVENYNKNRRPAVTDLNKLSYKTAFIIGLFQVLSLVPGTSRSGSTILLKLVKFGFHYTGAEIFILVVGMATAFVVSIISIKFLLQYIKNNDFKAFGYYRIVLGIIVIAYLFLVGDPTLQ